MIRPIIMILLISMPLITHSKNSTLGESGHFWCGERFLGSGTNIFGVQDESIAVKGYIYVLAAALALQKNNDEGNAHWFSQPKRMELIESSPPKKSGFQAITFRIKPINVGQKDEIVVAFTGSDQYIDWKANILRSRKQYDEAVSYIDKIHENYIKNNEKIIVTGISLGGGLAIHVTKNRLTKSYIQETWAINPSPVTFSDDTIDERIWLIYSRGEILSFVRDSRLLSLLRGMSNIGAPTNQIGRDYNLIKSNSIYAHFRWVITREILFAADYSLTNRGKNLIKTEPLEILKFSSFQSCSHITELRNMDNIMAKKQTLIPR